MKRIICIVMAAMMMACAAAELDYGKMSDGELMDVIRCAQEELFSRLTGDAVTGDASEGDDVGEAESEDFKAMRAGTILLDDAGIIVKLTGDPVGGKGYDGDFMVTVEAVVRNGSEHNVMLSGDSCYVNGWSVVCDNICMVDAGKKAKFTISFVGLGEAAEVTSLDMIEEIVMGLYAFDTDSYDEVTDTGYAVTLRM